MMKKLLLYSTVWQESLHW